MNMLEFVEKAILRHDSMGVIFYDTIPESLTVYIPNTIKKIMLRRDTIGVLFGYTDDTLVLYYDCANLKILKEENYFAASKGEGFISHLYDLTEEERGIEFICRKRSLGARIFSTVSSDYPRKTSLRQRPKPDIRKVKFGSRFVLYWDCANDEIMEDENFFAILQNKENIYSMASFITDKKVVCDNVRSKKDRIFKKGDIAYLFLSEYYNKLISSSECLGIQLERFLPGCEYNEGLLDYIEKNRNLVFQKVMSCLDSASSAVRSDKTSSKATFPQTDFLN